MDSLTQIVLGAAVGELVLGKKVGNKAMLYGAIAGTIPDLDVLSRSFMSDLSANEVHRGVTHSLLFCLVMAPFLGMWVKKHTASFLSLFTVLLTLVFVQGVDSVAETVVWWAAAAVVVFLIFRRNRVDDGTSVANWSWLFWWSLVTHPLLDCHTTWGTQFFWPLPLKFAFNNIFVADPLYTLPFLIFLIVAMCFKRNDPRRWRYNQLGLYVSSGYMVLTLFSKYIAHSSVKESLIRQEIDFETISTRPTPLNTVLWTVSVDAGDRYLLAYHSHLDTKPEVAFVPIQKNHHLLNKWADHKKVKRLKHLAQGQFVITKEEEKVIFNDLRFGQIGEPSEDKPFLFRYVLIPDGEDLIVQQYQRPELQDTPFSSLIGQLVERIKGE